MRNMKLWIAMIAILVVGAVYVQHSKTRYTASSEDVFSADREEIQRVLIRTGDTSLELVNAGGEWRIAGNDTLVVRQDRLDALLNKALAVKRTTVMTEKAEKWGTYSVDDSTGTHIALVDPSGGMLGEVVFGRSMSDWSKSYVRLKPDPAVYLTDHNVMYYLSTEATFWGEKPEPPEAPADSSLQDAGEKAVGD